MRSFLWTLMFSFLPFVPGFSQTAGLPGPVAPSAADQIGVAAAVRGAVEIVKTGQVGHVVQSGEPIFLGDQITTDAQGHLQILLMDETVFTLGPNSALVIDRFVYDPSTNNGKVNAKVVKGVFRFVTGKIGRKKPSDMEVALPSGTIGIRGTIVAGRTEGARSLVVLLGPGKKNNTGDKEGSITVGNKVGDQMKSVDVTRAGYGTVIEGEGKAPSPAFEVPESDLNALTDALSPDEGGAAPGEEGEGGEGSATEDAGQDTAESSENVSETLESESQIEALTQETTKAAQDAADSGAISNGISTLEQLRTIQTGQFHYKATSVPLLNGGSSQGTYTIKFNIDFGARTVGGGNSALFSGAISNFSNQTVDYTLTSQSFASGSGNATFTYTNLSNAGSCSASCNTNSISITVNNSNGVIGANADHAFSVTQGASPTNTGSGNLARNDGLA